MKRVRVLGDLYHGRVPEGAVYVGRAAPGLKASPYANPFRAKLYGDYALHLYAQHLDAHPELVERARSELAGKDLACWCKIDQPCHVDELLRRIGAPAGHRWQHSDSPTWCIDCGAFGSDAGEPCPTPGANRFDTRDRDTLIRMYYDIFEARDQRERQG